MRHPILAGALLGAFALPSLSACTTQRDARAERPPDIRIRPGEPERGDPTIVAVRKIVTDQDKVHLGYLKVKEAPPEKGSPRPVRVSWVLDKAFAVRGFYTEDGRTYRLTRDGEFEPAGVHHVDTAKLVLLGRKERVALALQPMDAPRTLESDAERERQAKAAAAAEAAKKAAPAAEGGAGEGSTSP